MTPPRAKPAATLTSSRAGGNPRFVLGLMAGTSADGIDAACVRVIGRGANMRASLVLHRHFAFPRGLRRRLLAAMAPAATTTEEIAALHADLGEVFAAAAGETIARLRRASRPSLIGLAGQTVCHLPGRRPYRTVTLQLGDPARVAERTGLPTVAEFRQADVAAGGQGAPLVPWTDWVLFRHPTLARGVQNIGGIGNLTWIPPGATADDVVAFDTGPGNMVMDGLVSVITGGRQSMDRDGRLARRGRVLPEVLAAWLKHPFLRQPLPRTTGRETFGRPFIEQELPRLRAASDIPADWVATAAAFTARTIADALRAMCRGLTAFSPSFTRQARGSSVRGRKKGRGGSKSDPPAPVAELIIAGGGARNGALMALLSRELPRVAVRAIDVFGIPVDAKEAFSFALLAAACVDRVPANLPQATGARRPAVLGSLRTP